MTIEIKDFLMDQLNQEELNELTLGLLSYKMNNVIPEFSSKLITISFLFSINNIVINQHKENTKKSRSEINRQNVMNRWHNKKRNIMLDDDNTYTNNAKSDTISNTKSDTKSDTNLDTKLDTKIIQNYTNENIVEHIDNKAENNKKSIIQTHTNTIQNLYEQSDTKMDTKMDTKSIQKDIQNDTEIIQNNLNEEVIKKIDNFEEFKNKEITQNNINSDAKDNINISTRDNAKDDKNLKQLLNEFVTLKASENNVDSKKNVEHTKAKPKLPDIIRDDKGEGKGMKSVANILSGMKITITRVEDLPALEDSKQDTVEYFQGEKYSKLKQDKNNKNDSDTDLLNLKDTQNQIKNNKNLKEKESNKEKENNNNIYIYNNIYNNKNNNNNNNIYNNIYNNISEYSLERGCGGKPFLNDDSNVIDATVLYAQTEQSVISKEKLSIAEAPSIVQYIEPVTITKKKKNEFVPPLLEEIKKYCQDKNLNVDTEHWYNYYEANDWKVNNRGKLVPMKNWKQALLTWHNNSKRYNINKSKLDSENVYSRKMTDKKIDEYIAITEKKYETIMKKLNQG